MDLSFYPVASSSKGNCYIIRSESTNIMVDIGITIRALRGYFNNINVDITEHRIDGLLVTHEHIDHVRNVNNIMNESLKCNLFCSKGTGEAISQKMKKVDPERVNYIEKNQTFMVGDIEVTAFGICHDAAEPLSYTFSKNGKKISIITDTGKMDEEMDEAIADSDVLIIESNPEVNILLYGRYPYHVKRRKLGSRVIRQFSPEINKTGVLTCSTSRKAICGFIVMARFHTTSRS